MIRELFLLALAAGTPSAAALAKCKCSPSQSCWPSTAEIQAFGQTLSSPAVLLSNIRPPASVCHGVSYNAAACTAANASWNDPFWRSEQPGGMQTPLLESQSPYSTNQTLACDVATPRDAPCGQGEVPTVGIAAQTDDDVVKALDFAHQHNLRVVVKNTGHDFYGRSTAADAFLIWTHQIKHRTLEETFVPAGCSQSYTQALRIGSGVQWNEAYETAATQKRVLAGGISSNGTVGAAGGWLTAAGHSILSPTFGLGVDNVIQFRVVMPSTDKNVAPGCEEERVVDVSACSHPDHFWALRGGGGSSFGVITEVVYRTHDDFTGLLGVVNITTSDPAVANQALVEMMHTVGTTFFDQHWGGYSFFYPPSPGDSQYHVAQILYKTHVVFGSEDEKKYNQTFDQLLQSLQKVSGSSTPPGALYRLPSFQYILDALTNPTTSSATAERKAKRDTNPAASQSPTSDAGTVTGFGTSRLLPRSLFADRDKLATYFEIVNGSYVLGHSVLGGQVAAVSPDSAAAHPGWRKNAVHVISVPIAGLTYDQAREQRQQVTELVWGKDAEAEVASYLNEQTPEEQYWPAAFYGDHWPRLSTIKRRVDPMDQLIVTKGVGSERWSQDGNCRVG